MYYQIKTKDGVVVRKQANRPYVEALVHRCVITKEVVYAERMSSKAKHLDGQYEGHIYINNRPCTSDWEYVIAVEIK
jgi:hypothetical protein